MKILGTYNSMKSNEFGESLITQLEEKFEIDLKSIIFDKNLTIDNIRDKAVILLTEGARKHHKKMGNTDWLSSDMGDLAPEPNLFMSAENAKDFSELRGDDIRTQLQISSKRLADALESPNYGMASFYIFAGGFLGVTTISAGAFVTAYVIAGEIAAVQAGLKALKGNAIAAIAILVIMLIIFFIFLRPSKLLGLMINRTSDNLIVNNYKESDGDLYLNTGKMSAFMVDHAKIGEVKPNYVQIHGMMRVTADFSIAFGGWYFAEKRDWALLGADGAMVFTSTNNDKLKFAHQYSVPYSRSNGTNIKKLTSNDYSMEKIFTELRDNQSQEKTVTDSGYTLTSAINDTSGQEVSLIASIADDNDPINKALK
jgi:hypothetical protein